MRNKVIPHLDHRLLGLGLRTSSVSLNFTAFFSIIAGSASIIGAISEWKEYTISSDLYTFLIFQCF